MRLTTDRIAERLWFLYTLIFISFLSIIGALFYFQIYQSDMFFLRSKKNFLRHETINSLRGAIVDCNGIKFATNRPVTNLVWHGTGNKTLSEEQVQVLSILETITGINFRENQNLINCERRGKDFRLLNDIPFDQLSKISEQLAHYANITLETDFARHYPYKTFASHILGYFRDSQDEGMGKMGLERLFEEQLRGEPGELEKTINSIGTNLEIRKVRAALDGQTIKTTIDFQLQQIAEKLFEENQSGTVLVMNPNTGDLRVVMSRPAFDPNIFLGPISTEEWRQLQEQKPFINRGLNACYPPASLFKLITTTAGLEEGIIDTCQEWSCTGNIYFGGRTYLCNRRWDGHGSVTIEDALAQSCNIPFYEIGKKITIDKLAEYAHKFGLGEKTGTILPEQAGLVPTAEWKQLTYGEPWWQGETLNAVIGQGPFLVTPLQMARMVGGICTGNLVRPRILANESIEIQPLQISSKTRSFLQESMRMTVQHGTGRNLNKLKDIEIYAKTGTCQTSHRSKRKLGKKFLEHAWFMCYAQYQEYEPLILVILIEHVGTARFATRMAKQFFIEYCKLMDKEKSSELP